MKETSKYHDELGAQAINTYQNMSENDVDQLIKKWTKAFTEVNIYIFSNLYFFEFVFLRYFINYVCNIFFI